MNETLKGWPFEPLGATTEGIGEGAGPGPL